MTTQVFDDLSDVTFRGYQFFGASWDADDETQERLDATYVDSGRCDDESPPISMNMGYFCTRTQGHPGPHVGHAYDPILGRQVACGIWD